MSLRLSTRTEVRKKAYKTGVDPDQARRRREDNLVIIRKTRREESLVKKRRELSAFAAAALDVDTSPLASAVDDKLKDLPTMVQFLCYGDPQIQLDVTTGLRKLLSAVRNPPIEEVIKAGAVPWFVKFLSRYDMPQLQFEAAWALTNIASGTSENTCFVIEQGALPVLVELLSSPCDDVREQAIWALGNIAGDSPGCRDTVLHHGALIPLLAQLNSHAKMTMLRYATWTLSNLCRGTLPPTITGQIRAVLPVLYFLIQLTDEEILSDVCWSLSYISDGSNGMIQAITESGVCPRIIELLLHPSKAVCIPALKTLGNLVTADDTQTQVLIDNKALPCLFQLLTQQNKKSIIREVCWAISNITAGNKDQIQVVRMTAVIDANIISHVVHLLHNSEFDIKKEAAWVLTNAIAGGSHDQIRFLISQGCIPPICALLSCPDPKLVTVCLDSLENILMAAEVENESGRDVAVNIYAQMIDECEGFDKIESLQTHDNSTIYTKSVRILEKYWDTVDFEPQMLCFSFLDHQFG